MDKGHLPGAYYGPTIPPRQSYRSVGRSRGSGCFDCLCCLPRCICECVAGCICKILLTIVIVLGIIVLILWLIFRPSMIKAHVDTAELREFSVGANNTLSYNLAATIQIRNPNSRIAFYYDYLEARAIYADQRFGFNNSISPFFQKTDTTTNVSTSFSGTQLLLGDGVVAGQYELETGKGIYSVDLQVYTKLGLKAWLVTVVHWNPTIRCNLKMPKPGSGGAFAGADCAVY